MRGSPGAGGAAVAVIASPETRRRVLLSSLAFVVGFSLVFVMLGASASFIGQFVTSRLTLLGRIAGAVIIIFGLHTMGVLRIEWLYQEKRVQTTTRPVGFVGAVLVGMAFAFGWTPCLGPILAGILAVAATQNTVGQGVRLLLAYSLGLGRSLLRDRVGHQPLLRRVREKSAATITRLRSPLERCLIVIGLLIFTNKFTVIAQFLSPYLPVY